MRSKFLRLELLQQHIESLIFISDHPISLKEIKDCLEESFDVKFQEADLLAQIDNLKTKYAQDDFAFEINEIAEGYQFLSKAAYHPTIGTYLKQKTKKRLSRSALETLSIIAYKQPATKSEVERIRGVNCDYALQKLLDKELVSILGRSDGPGRPLLYGTSERFMNYFGLKNLRDLPTPKDFKTPDSSIGELGPIVETVAEENKAEAPSIKENKSEEE